MASRDEHDDQRAILDEDPESTGGDASGVASVSDREAVAEDEDELFGDEDDEDDDRQQ